MWWGDWIVDENIVRAVRVVFDAATAGSDCAYDCVWLWEMWGMVVGNVGVGG